MSDDPLRNTILSSREKCALRELGWVKLASDAHNEIVLASHTLMLAEELGTPIRGRLPQVVEALVPKVPEEAHPASLSRKFGLDAFPFHADSSHWTVPARFVILSCVSLGKCMVPTLLVYRDTVLNTDDKRTLARSAVFLVKDGRNSFYSSILGMGRDFIRYDPGCMEPQTLDAVEALRLFSHERVSPFVQKVDWKPGDSIVIDNWRMLHARAAVSTNSSKRLLLRCLVS